MEATIIFKTKIAKLKRNMEDIGIDCFNMKKTFSRHDIENIKELSSHWGINSDLMPQIIARGIKKAFNKDNIPEYIKIDENMPSFISIEYGFLSTIRLKIDI